MTEGIWRYYFLWAKLAFIPSFGLSDLYSSLVATFFGIICHYLPNGEQFMKNISWQISLWIFTFFLIIRIVLAPYWIWKEQRKNICELEEKVNIKTNYKKLVSIIKEVVDDALPIIKGDFGYNPHSETAIWLTKSVQKLDQAGFPEADLHEFKQPNNMGYNSGPQKETEVRCKNLNLTVTRYLARSEGI